MSSAAENRVAESRVARIGVDGAVEWTFGLILALFIAAGHETCACRQAALDLASVPKNSLRRIHPSELFLHKFVSDKCLINATLAEHRYRRKHGCCGTERICSMLPTEQEHKCMIRILNSSQRWVRHVSCHTARYACECCSGCHAG